MARVCLICTSPHREAIDHILREEEYKWVVLEKRFQIPRYSFRWHVNHSHHKKPRDWKTEYKSLQERYMKLMTDGSGVR